jgi:hypothetical protein
MIEYKIKEKEVFAFAIDFTIMYDRFVYHPGAPGMISLIPIVIPLVAGNVIV